MSNSEDSDTPNSFPEAPGANAEQIEIVLDAEGRPRGVTEGINYDFQVYQKALKGNLELFRHDCEQVFSVRAVRGDEEYSSGETYFIGAKEEPAAEVERLAKMIFDFHARNSIGVDLNKSGAEWWTQVIDADDDIGAHFDRDYTLEEDEGVNIHPHLGTVTYLSDAGAPTFVVELKAPTISGQDLCGAGFAEKAIVSFPKEGNHLCFDGRFLHCAPADLLPLEEGRSEEPRKRKSKSKRISFLVNVWLNYVPSHADRFPSERLNQLKTPSGSVTVTPAQEMSIARVSCSTQDSELRLGFVEASRRMELVAHVPKPVLKHSQSILLSFEEGACELKAGELVEQESSDQDSVISDEDEDSDK
ncbi:hypothetical protein NDN08_008334 [Rhodosorus marinus]|uniref:Uncharacterized protein n=1 Tax=Rhodosorus marinus TaxID=101924 RepID=A0AAV8V3T1_9RHOD|nr:hypothetical protein NDN08_008334 [Rhodosorus marinus]